MQTGTRLKQTIWVVRSPGRVSPRYAGMNILVPSNPTRPSASLTWGTPARSVREIIEAFQPSLESGPWKHVSRNRGKLKWHRRGLAIEQEREANAPVYTVDAKGWMDGRAISLKQGLANQIFRANSCQ
jgi:hypothetical protein